MAQKNKETKKLAIKFLGRQKRKNHHSIKHLQFVRTFQSNPCQKQNKNQQQLAAPSISYNVLSEAEKQRRNKKQREWKEREQYPTEYRFTY